MRFGSNVQLLNVCNVAETGRYIKLIKRTDKKEKIYNVEMNTMGHLPIAGSYSPMYRWHKNRTRRAVWENTECVSEQSCRVMNRTGRAVWQPEHTECISE